jgi:hypothetical protein
VTAPTPRLPPIDRRAALAFAVALAALLAPWPGVGRAFAAAFGAYANVVTSMLDLGGEAPPRFSRPPRGVATSEDGGDWAVALAVDAKAEEGLPILLDTRVLAYTPVAVLLALAVGSRLSRRRRLMVLGFGLLVLLARTALAIALPVARRFEGTRAGWAFGPIAEIVWFGLVTPPVMSYATPLLAWWTGFALTTPAAASSRRRTRTRQGARSAPSVEPPD